jgi:hypothetical protein
MIGMKQFCAELAAMTNEQLFQVIAFASMDRRSTLMQRRPITDEQIRRLRMQDRMLIELARRVRRAKGKALTEAPK